MASRSRSIVLAAAAYWAIVFAAGFVLGTLRILVLEPALGSLTAVLLELPMMLAASWLAAHWLVDRYAIKGRAEALAMGVIAFALLMASEAALTTAMANNSPAQWIAGMATPAGFIGLCGQVAFGLFPWLIQSAASRQ